jgi:hypothetical protein
MKRYDLEEAKASIEEAARRTISNATVNIERAAESAIDRLNAESATIDTLGSPVELYEKAAIASVRTIDLTGRGSGGKINVYDITIQTPSGQFSLVGGGGESPDIPAKKYRALFFLIPVET